MNASLSLLIGIIVGVAAASVVWFAVGAAKRKKHEGQKRAKEEVMTAIGELLADADAYEASYRCGAITASRFSQGLIDKVNAITRPLRTNMHILDVFFVKYAEQQVDEYMRMIENPERRAEARKAIHAALLGGGEEAGSEAAAPIAEQQEEAAPNYEEQDIFDAAEDLPEETFTSSPAPDTDAYEASEEEIVIAPEPEVVFEDAEAEEETPPEEQVFGDGSEAAASGSGEAASGSWLDKSLEEFEAGFAKFEPQGATTEESVASEEAEAEAGFAEFEAQEVTVEEPPVSEEAEEFAVSEEAESSAEFAVETGNFAVSRTAEPPEPVVEEPKPEPEPELEDEEEDVFDVQAPPPVDAEERTETQRFDKPAVEEAEPKQEEKAAERDGITGDDVSSAIDNFFKL